MRSVTHSGVESLPRSGETQLEIFRVGEPITANKISSSQSHYAEESEGKSADLLILMFFKVMIY